jgi:tocopherol O-methyltransferase
MDKRYSMNTASTNTASTNTASTNTASTLYQRIGQFYDNSSSLWEAVWGEHMHHGYYGLPGNPTSILRKDRYQAQIDLIEALLSWGQVQRTHTILDAGCGIGGSTLYLAQKFAATAVGITLSPKQAQRATERAEEQAIPLTTIDALHNTQEANHQGAQEGAQAGAQVLFQVENALQTPFADNTFDLIWTLESGEHMPDKRLFLQECYRQLKPGGTLLLATWCHRPTDSLAGSLTASEQSLLRSIYDIYCLPYVISLPEYVEIAQSLNFQHIRSADWSEAVAPFWPAVIRSALEPAVLLKILGSGWSMVQNAIALNLMDTGFKQGLIRYGLLCGQK